MLTPKKYSKSSDNWEQRSTDSTSQAVYNNLELSEDVLNRQTAWAEISKETGVSLDSIEIWNTIKIKWVWEFKLNDEEILIRCRNDFSIFSTHPDTEDVLDENIEESDNGWYVPWAPSYELWENFIAFIRQINQSDNWGMLVEKFLNGVMLMKSRDIDRWNWANYASCNLKRNLIIAPDMLTDDLLFTELLDDCEVYNVRLIV